MTSKAVLAYANRINDNLAAVTGTWTARPLANLAIPQLPVPYALATPDDGELAITWTPDTATPVDVLAVLAHTLPAGAVVTWTDEAETVLASVTWNPGANEDLAPNVVAVLANPATIEELTVTITNAGSDPVRIAGLWASISLRDCNESGWGFAAEDYSLSDMVEATLWANRRTRANSIAGAFPYLTEDQAIGTAGGVNLRAVFRQSGNTEPVIWIPRTHDQTSINITHVLGFFDQPGRVTQRGGPWWRADFTVREMR